MNDPESTFENTLHNIPRPLPAQQDEGSLGNTGTTNKSQVSGATLGGRYQVQHAIGRGGMGVVYLGKDHHMGEEVAIKFIPDVIKSDDAAISELKSETRKGRRLTHRNIVRVIELLEDPPAIVMEYIDGPTLSSLRLKQTGQIFEVDAKFKGLIDQLLAALEYAHDTARIVHRDLKPANIMVTSAGQLKVTDFGIACSLRDSVSRVSVSQNNTSGSPHYMSPQQWMGSVPSESDDIYALGATIYELITSKPPFYNGDISKQVELKRPPSMTERRAELGITGAPIPQAWEDVVAGCLEKEPQSRPISIAAVRVGLTGQPFERGAKTLRGSIIRPGQAMPGAATQRAQQQTATAAPVQQGTLTGGNKWLHYAAAAVVAVGGFMYYQNGQEAERRQKAAMQEQEIQIATEAKKRKTADDTLADLSTKLSEAKKFAETDAAALAIQKKFDDVAAELSDFQHAYDDTKRKSMLRESEKLSEEWKTIHTEGKRDYESRLSKLKEDQSEIAKQIRANPSFPARAQAEFYSMLLAENTGFESSYGDEHQAILSKIEKLVIDLQKQDQNQRPTTLFTMEQGIADTRVMTWKEAGKAELLKKAQQALAGETAVGYAGLIDGKWSQATQDALVKYQDLKNLAPTGKLDLATVNTLGLATVAGGPELGKAVTSTASTGSSGSSSRRSYSSGSSNNNSSSSGGGLNWKSPETYIRLAPYAPVPR